MLNIIITISLININVSLLPFWHILRIEIYGRIQLINFKTYIRIVVSYQLINQSYQLINQDRIALY